MIQQVLKNYPLVGVASLGLLLFVVVFLAAYAWAFRKGSQPVHDRASRMVLDDEDGADTGHDYDGIRELDNRLPNWWLATLYGSIVFSIGYYGYYQIGHGPTLVDEYKRDPIVVAQAKAEGEAKSAIPDEGELTRLVADTSRRSTGHDVFLSKCSACHGKEGQGGIGPNLTDEYWLHGGKLPEIARTIQQGVLDKGMPPWGKILSKDELLAVVSYVKSIEGTNPAGAKAPQGAKLVRQ